MGEKRKENEAQETGQGSQEVRRNSAQRDGGGGSSECRARAVQGAGQPTHRQPSGTRRGGGPWPPGAGDPGACGSGARGREGAREGRGRAGRGGGGARGRVRGGPPRPAPGAARSDGAGPGRRGRGRPGLRAGAGRKRASRPGPAPRLLPPPGSAPAAPRPMHSPCRAARARPDGLPRAAGGAPLSARAAAASPLPPRPPFRAPQCPPPPPPLWLLLLLGAARVGALRSSAGSPRPRSTTSPWTARRGPWALGGRQPPLPAVGRQPEPGSRGGRGPGGRQPAVSRPAAPAGLVRAPAAPHRQLQQDPGWTRQGLVVVCGSVYQGFCQLRRRGNISAVAVPFPPAAPPAAPVTVFPSMLNVAANHPNASTVGLLLAPAAGAGGSRLLVGATYTGYGSAFFPRNRSLEDHRFGEHARDRHPLPGRARRPGQALHLRPQPLRRQHSQDQAGRQGAAQAGRSAPSPHPPDPRPGAQTLRVPGAQQRGARGRQGEPGAEPAGAHLPAPRAPAATPRSSRSPTSSWACSARVARGRGDLQPPVRLPTRELLFAVFERPQGTPGPARLPAALCAFRFADVQAATRAARTACFVDPAPDVVAVLDSVVQGTGPACERKRNIQVGRPGRGRGSGPSRRAPAGGGVCG